MTPSPEAAQAIAHTKAKYCRLLDTQQWHLFDEIVLPDFKFRMVEDGTVVNRDGVDIDFQAREPWIAHFSELFKGKQSHHLVGPAELDEVSAGQVNAKFAVQYYVTEKEISPKWRMTGGGHYHEVYKRVDGAWFLAQCRIEETYFTIDS